MQKYVVCAIFAVLAFGVALHLQVMVWDGTYPLSVQVIVDGESPRIVQGISYQNELEAGFSTKDGFLEKGVFNRSTTADPFLGQSLIVNVVQSGRRTQLGWDYSRSQFHSLAILAEWPDGAKLIQFFPIPDGQKTRSLQINIKKPRLDEPQTA